MCKIGKVLDPDSNKYKLMFSKVDYVVSSHAENFIFNPLGSNGFNIRDQYHFKYVFLQHGITKDDLSPWLNVNTKKMDMFVAAVPLEYESLLKYKYYFGEDVIKLTGFPRYDTLLTKSKKIKPKKQILVSFTWRNTLASAVDPHTGDRLYNEDFKNTDYFKRINNFINDERLLKTLDEYGYKIKFLPHPNVITQLDDFTFNKYIDVQKTGIDYQKEFCENSLLITDYSSVYFDFGYLGKKVIYYQEDKEEFFKGQLFDQGYYDYEKMGFGPVVYSYDDLINETINSIKNDCIPDKNIQKRIDSFFEFQDDKNCERVYNNIKNL
jgi:CDP-glycerol glycerophosphotransferase (TagB/SpsB family)